MAITSFLFGGSPSLSKIGPLTIDAAINVNPSRTARASKNPIERGSNSSDNVALDNLQLSIEGIISESPLSAAVNLASGLAGSAAFDALQGITPGGQNAGLLQGAAGAVAAFGAGTAAGAIQGLFEDRDLTSERDGPNDTDFPKNAWNFLLKIQEDRLPITIVTGFKVYENMVITSLSSNQNASIGGSLSFNMSAEQILIVSTKTEKIPQSLIDESIAASAADKQDLGKQVASEASEQEAENSSILFNIFN